MAKITVPFTKDHEKVVACEQTAHQEYVDQILKEMEKQNLNKNRLTHMIGAEAPMTYRMLDTKENITLNTMIRYANALGKTVRIQLINSKN